MALLQTYDTGMHGYDMWHPIQDNYDPLFCYKKLLYETLKQSIETLIKSKGTDRYELNWIRYEGIDTPFSFETICDVLGFNADHIRTEINKFVETKTLTVIEKEIESKRWKQCKKCGEWFPKKPHVSHERFDSQKYCSLKCKLAAEQKVPDKVQAKIFNSYLAGVKYKDLQKKYKVSRKYLYSLVERFKGKTLGEDIKIITA